jgi:putative transposase
MISVLQLVIECSGNPKIIRMDNGPEFICDKLQLSCEEQQIDLQFIQPGKPLQNVFKKRSNRWFSKESLDNIRF